MEWPRFFSTEVRGGFCCHVGEGLIPPGTPKCQHQKGQVLRAWDGKDGRSSLGRSEARKLEDGETGGPKIESRPRQRARFKEGEAPLPLLWGRAFEPRPKQRLPTSSTAKKEKSKPRPRQERDSKKTSRTAGGSNLRTKEERRSRA